MAHDGTPFLGCVLPPSRVTSRVQTGLPEKFMLAVPRLLVVQPGEDRPTPSFLDKTIFMVPFALAGLVPPFSSFFYNVLEFYQIQILHLGPNSILFLSIFAYLCEMFVEVLAWAKEKRPSTRNAWMIEEVDWGPDQDLLQGLAFSARPSVLRHGGNQRRCGAAIVGLKKPNRRVSRLRPNRLFIRTFRKIGNPSPHHWFYTRLPNHPRLQLPIGPPVPNDNWLSSPTLGPEFDATLGRIAGLQAQGLNSHMVFGDFMRRRIAPLQARPRPAYLYTGVDDDMRTHVGTTGDWDPESCAMVIF
uniref:Transposase (putative) gypsy type domain-containing protein n=1 Tax=Oryza brachyantha TaxID=4533 RepID=J3KUJ6_ORYBR